MHPYLTLPNPKTKMKIKWRQEKIYKKACVKPARQLSLRKVFPRSSAEEPLKVNRTTSQGIGRGIRRHNLVHLSIVVNQRSRPPANVLSNILSRHSEKSKTDGGSGSKTVHSFTIIDAARWKVLDKSGLNGRGEKGSINDTTFFASWTEKKTSGKVEPHWIAKFDEELEISHGANSWISSLFNSERSWSLPSQSFAYTLVEKKAGAVRMF